MTNVLALKKLLVLTIVLAPKTVLLLKVVFKLKTILARRNVVQIIITLSRYVVQAAADQACKITQFVSANKLL